MSTRMLFFCLTRTLPNLKNRYKQIKFKFFKSFFLFLLWKTGWSDPFYILDYSQKNYKFIITQILQKFNRLILLKINKLQFSLEGIFRNDRFKIGVFKQFFASLIFLVFLIQYIGISRYFFQMSKLNHILFSLYFQKLTNGTMNNLLIYFKFLGHIIKYAENFP